MLAIMLRPFRSDGAMNERIDLHAVDLLTRVSAESGDAVCRGIEEYAISKTRIHHRVSRTSNGPSSQEAGYGAVRVIGAQILGRSADNHLRAAMLMGDATQRKYLGHPGNFVSAKPITFVCLVTFSWNGNGGHTYGGNARAARHAGRACPMGSPLLPPVWRALPRGFLPLQW